MEDGPNDRISDVEGLEFIKNGVAPTIMANFPEGTVAISKENKLNTELVETVPKVNGDSNPTYEQEEEEDYISESDALVIDENIPKKPVKKKRSVNKAVKEAVTATHSNPFFNESLFELSQKAQSFIETKLEGTCKFHNKGKRAKVKPPKREYAQYLGLQPTVQFKCPKCGQAGYESLASLNAHRSQCDAAEPTSVPTVTDSTSSSFKIKRKVFLCSACGTYYENCNLYLHMLELHKRFICLYCLGMFSASEDLCQHIRTRHNFEPGHKNTPDEFFSVYNEPCYIICCECNKLFSEGDNFFYHNCAKSNNNMQLNNSKAVKSLKSAQIRPENHVTGDSQQPNSNNTSDIELINNSDGENLDSCGKQNTEETVAVTSETQNAQLLTVNDTSEVTQNQEGEEEKAPSEPDQENEDNIETNCEVEDEIFKSNISDGSVLDDNDDDEEKPDNKDSPRDNHDSTMDQETEPLNCNTQDYLENTSLPGDNLEHFGEDMEVRSFNGSEIFSDEDQEVHEEVETRKVPKLSLKLPKLNSFQIEKDENVDSDDSEKLAMEVDQIESENEINAEENILSHDEDINVGDEKTAELESDSPGKEQFFQVAGSDVSIVELELEQPLDKFDIRVLLQKCLKASAPFCIYCNHARKIAVNGRQLGLHAIAEHRFSAIVNSITAEELIPETFVSRIKESLDDLIDVFFSLESSASDEAVTFSHVFECFQCRYSTTIHKELYLHNRKLHTKNLLLCIMCKSNFYSYSELICHLCPGLYILDYDLQYRCCMCVSDNLPSSFRLMVHLRKRHHVCDVCLEMCHNQYKLSNHVWKHKLHHFCYRCGIAYRNKPDITRHLFWKHGTESVLCKKCLQKKWPHVYHFCVPPVSFLCDECNLTFSKAVALKVHKRIHADEKPHKCTFDDCTETFISKKLLRKHELKHLEPVNEEPKKIEEPIEPEVQETENPDEKRPEKPDSKENPSAIEVEKLEEKPKPKVDICDLPELNLSESDSSDSEDDAASKVKEVDVKIDEVVAEFKTENSLGLELNIPGDNLAFDFAQENVQEIKNDAPVLDNIWDDFKNYQAEKEKIDHLLYDKEKLDDKLSEQIIEEEESLTAETALMDHDYCFNPELKPDTSLTEVKPDLSQRVDHDYCSPKGHNGPPTNQTDEPSGNEKNKKSPRKRTNSSSSSNSGSDSSSCTCGSNCSCSSSSGSSSSSSDSSNSDSSTEEGRRKQQLRREKRRERAKQIKSEGEKIEVTAPTENPVVVETPILESDLETTESETDEEFYDKQPHKIAKKILEEKRNQLLAEVGSLPPNGSWLESSRPATPNLLEEQPKPKKKSKSKKKKKRKSERKEQESRSLYLPASPLVQFQQTPLVAPITISLSARNSPIPQPTHTITQAGVYPRLHSPLSRQDSSDSSLRASKRRRVPNKFYGYSSDEEGEKGLHHVQKWRKSELHPHHHQVQQPQPPLLVPPLTIKTAQITQQPPIEPLTIRPSSRAGEMRVLQKGVMTPPIRMIPPRPPPVPNMQFNQQVRGDSGSDSNDSSSEENNHFPSPPKPIAPQLYCYCRCPYDEVSEMIGCDSNDCAIEWFHFECVGIMVPPKGQWFCPDCRKKKQQRREMLQT